MSNFDDFADLNAAIAVQLESRQAAAEARAAKARLSRLPANSVEAAADRAKIAEWESKHEWKAVGMIAVFEHETCEACDTTGERFVQFLQEEHHRRERGARRLQAKPAPIPTVPPKNFTASTRSARKSNTPRKTPFKCGMPLPPASGASVLTQ